MTDIIKTSASAIESFDDSSPFGCQRRWFFKSVLKVPEPPRDNLTLGTNLHSAIENFLIKSAPGEMTPEVQRLFHAIKAEVIRVRDEGFLALEHPIDFLMAPDVRIIGRIDVLRKNGPLDWKTSSDVGKYAPTPYKLARSTQMVTYAQWQFQEFFPVHPEPALPTQVTHVYVQTKGAPVTQRIDAMMTPALLTEGVSRVINIAREMKEALSLPNTPEGANDLRPDRSKCRGNTKRPCPYINICPVEKAAMSSALDRLKARLNTAPMPSAQKAVVDAVKTIPAVQSIVPPDAPAPAPVEKFMAVPPPKAPAAKKLVIQEPAPEPAPEVLSKPSAEPSADVTSTVTAPPAATEAPKRGPGRPPGAKNKSKAAEPTNMSEWRDQEGRAPAVIKEPLTFRTVTVTMTGKLNMGHFQSMDICVSQTAEYRGDPETAFIRVTDVVKKQLDAALENIAGRTVQAPVPADVLNSTKR